MNQIQRLFWSADYLVTVHIDSGQYDFNIPREYLENAAYEGEDIHKAATEFVLDGLEESNVICKDLRKLLYLHVFNCMLRQLPLRSEKKSFLRRLRNSVG